MRWMVLVVVGGCWAQPAPIAAPRPQPSASVTPEPIAEPRPPLPPSNPHKDGSSLGPRRNLIAEERVGVILEGSMNRTFPDVTERDALSSCRRDFVQKQPELARRSLTAVLDQYLTRCEAEGIVLERPLSDGRERRARSDVSFTGTVSQRPELVLRVAYCGGESASPDHVTIVADGTSWTSPRLEFQRDGNTCDVAELPLTRALARILEHATESTDVTLSFEGHAISGELAIGDTIKHELRVVLDAFEALVKR